MEKFNEHLGKAIVYFRKKSEITQEELADNANIHTTYVSQIERGLKTPTINVLNKISNALKIKLSDLIIDVEKRVENEI